MIPSAPRSLLSLVLACALLPDALVARDALDKPNVIIVFLDDCGYGDFAHTGNPTIDTPHISRLVREGLNFPQFYTASPACTASRYALLTGRNPLRSGLGTWVLPPNASKYIHPNEVTIAEGLRQRGYATGMFGKWHLGNPNSANGMTADCFPLAHGFDEWLGTNVSNDYDSGADLIRSDPAGTTPIAGYQRLAQDIEMNVPVQESLTQRYRDGAEAFIRAHRDEPFFCYLAPNMPHLPIHASQPFQGQSLRGRYGDVIEEIDAMVGRLRAVLEEENIATNTLLVFTSDNGPWIRYDNVANDPRRGDTRLEVGSALPFRDGKGSTWEGGVRVPGVFYWPGTIPAASVQPTPASTLDLLPTIFALADQSLPADRTLDGRDLRPFFNAATFPGTVSAFEFIYTGASDNKIYGARKGPWKLHTRLYSQTGNNYGFSASPNNPLLFNVEQDPHERIDRAAAEPGQTSLLQGVLTNFTNSVNREQTFWGAP